MSQVANPVTNPAVRRRSQRVLMQVSVAYSRHRYAKQIL